MLMSKRKHKMKLRSGGWNIMTQRNKRVEKRASLNFFYFCVFYLSAPRHDVRLVNRLRKCLFYRLIRIKLYDNDSPELSRSLILR